MNHCHKTGMGQFIIPLRTSSCIQEHDRVNDCLHRKYEEKKDEIYSCYSSLNCEIFLNILVEIQEEWATPEMLVKVGKRVLGISKSGLNIDWMDQKKS